MSRYPHTKLFYDPRRLVVLSGPHIQILDSSGRILYSTAKFAQQDEVIKSGPIRCSGMSQDGRYLATIGDDKRLKLWDVESLALLGARSVPKKPTCLEFSNNMNIIVSDKFGDVFRWTLPHHTSPDDKPVEQKSTSHSFASYGNASDGDLILGHASLLTGFVLTPDERFIITADRDEHIRVSWYPYGYNIESYCLGHKKYVSAIHIPVAFPASLISGGGDGELKVWHWMTGQFQRDISIFAVIEPFIIKTSDATATVFVVRQIDSFVCGDETHVVFSMVGGTAIFEFIFSDADDQSSIRHYDFGRPVINFTVCGDGLVWVLLDADNTEEHDTADEVVRSRKLVRTVRWSVDQFVDAGNSALLDSLNTICSLPATSEDLKALDLYSDLESLPKTVDGEHERSQLVNEPPEGGPSGGDASIGVALTKRALGRLKHKRALDQLRTERGDGCAIVGPGNKKRRPNLDHQSLHGVEYDQEPVPHP